MKILYFHNYYKYRGGEDISFELDVEMLRDYSHEVVEITRDNSDIERVSATRMAVDAVWNQKAFKESKRLIEEHQPDLVHCNNLFPQFSISVLHAARKMKVPVVQALRNYRSFCANAFFYRDGKRCELCRNRIFALPAIYHACYRKSRKASATVAVMQTTQRLARSLGHHPDAYITPSDFARSVHVDAGLPAERVFARTNFLYPDPGAGEGAGNYAIYVGRLSEEKGVETILDAWSDHKISKRLMIVGTGPLEDAIRERAGKLDNVEMIGECSLSKVLELIGDASFLIMPSKWYETFGRTIAESFAKGTPVIASRLGAMAELVQHGVSGLLFEPGDSDDLAECVKQLSDDSPRVRQFRRDARDSYLSKFTREKSYHALNAIYSQVLNE